MYVEIIVFKDGEEIKSGALSGVEAIEYKSEVESKYADGDFESIEVKYYYNEISVIDNIATVKVPSKVVTFSTISEFMGCSVV